jgi:hypothetical protein
MRFPIASDEELDSESSLAQALKKVYCCYRQVHHKYCKNLKTVFPSCKRTSMPQKHTIQVISYREQQMQ